MIVRILTEGQYNLPGQFVDKLNEVDNQIVAVVEVNDEVSFKLSTLYNSFRKNSGE